MGDCALTRSSRSAASAAQEYLGYPLLEPAGEGSPPAFRGVPPPPGGSKYGPYVLAADVPKAMMTSQDTLIDRLREI
eukprot:544846-Prorocentrum_minimum.AAC.1